MKFRPILLAALTAFVLVSCQGASDYLINGSDIDEIMEGNVVINKYPTTILPYNSLEVLRLQEEVKSLNKKYNSKYKYMPPRLTKYGFPDSDIQPIMNMEYPNIVIEDGEEMKKIAKSTLEAFSKFTGVKDLSVSGIKSSRGSTFRKTWEVATENQIYEGLEVKNTSIVLKLTINGVYRIFHNWYSYIYIPDHTISENQAKESIIGMTLTEQTGLGDPLITIVNQEMMTKPAKKVVLPVVGDDNIVLHVAWEIPISENNSTHHFIYVDVVSNKVIKIQPLRIIN